MQPSLASEHPGSPAGCPPRGFTQAPLEGFFLEPEPPALLLLPRWLPVQLLEMGQASTPAQLCSQTKAVAPSVRLFQPLPFSSPRGRARELPDSTPGRAGVRANPPFPRLPLLAAQTLGRDTSQGQREPLPGGRGCTQRTPSEAPTSRPSTGFTCSSFTHGSGPSSAWLSGGRPPGSKLQERARGARSSRVCR